MKNFLFILFVLVIGSIASCKKDSSQLSTLSAILLAKDTTALNVGDTKSITFTLTPTTFDKTQLIWHSSDNSILTIDNAGVITGRKVGVAVVTVTAPSATVTAFCLVNVMPQLKAITLAKDTLIMNAGDVRNVGFTVTPANSDKSTLVWKSSDTTILKVSATGAVTAKNAGAAIVTVTSQEGLLYKNCLISVLPDPLTTGLIAYYPFNNSAKDLSGNGYDGTAFNITSATDRLGNTTGAYAFNGSTSYISVPDNQNLRLSNTDFTLNAWVKINAYGASYAENILTKRLAGISNGWTFGFLGQAVTPTGVIEYGPGGSGINSYGTTVLTLNQWHMLTVIYTVSKSQVDLYLDGSPTGSVTGTYPNGFYSPSTAGIASPGAVNALMYIGKEDPSIGVNYYFNGSMDDVRIYGKALTKGQVQQLFVKIN